jgi:hypothetical protein
MNFFREVGPDFCNQRVELMDQLVKIIQDYGFAIIKGSPTSGKTTTLKLFYRHVARAYPNTKLYYTFGWKKATNANGMAVSWDVHLNNEVGRSDLLATDEGTLLLIDEAQESLEDLKFWHQGLKEVKARTPTQPRALQGVVAVSGFGSVTKELSKRKTTSPFITSIFQTISLFPEHISSINYTAKSLLLTEVEAMDIIAKKCLQSGVFFDDDLSNHLYALSGGHVGVLDGLLTILGTSARTCFPVS